MLLKRRICVLIRSTISQAPPAAYSFDGEGRQVGLFNNNLVI